MLVDSKEFGLVVQSEKTTNKYTYISRQQNQQQRQNMTTTNKVFESVGNI